MPTTEPASEPRTTSVSPSWTAIRAMISSGALPNVALRKPPIPGPVCSAACSVASPISQASGISASAERSEERRVAEIGEVVEGDDDGPEGQAGEEDSSDHVPGYPTHHAIRAVFFDWGDTLVAWEFDSGALRRGAHSRARGLRPGARAARIHRAPTAGKLLPLLVGRAEDEIDYAAEVAPLLASLGATPTTMR